MHNGKLGGRVWVWIHRAFVPTYAPCFTMIPDLKVNSVIGAILLQGVGRVGVVHVLVKLCKQRTS